MKIGILSDTHGRAFLAQQAVKCLTALGAEFFVHCGDVADFGGSLTPVLQFMPPQRSAFVFGNADLLRDEAMRFAAERRVTCLGTSGIIELAGKKIAVAHGDDWELISAFFDRADELDCLLTGHTHMPHDLSRVKPRRINPGALYDPRKGSQRSVAALDLHDGGLQFVSISAN